MLADIYFHAIQVRRNTPVSFQMLVTRLGVFKYIAVMSNEELQQLSHIDKVKRMPIYASELIQGPNDVQKFMTENNNKFDNLKFMNDDEQQVYLAPSPTRVTVSPNESVMQGMTGSSSSTLNIKKENTKLSNQNKTVIRTKSGNIKILTGDQTSKNDIT